MPKTVEFPELGPIDFPDDMSWEEVQGVLDEKHDVIRGQLRENRIRQMEAETNLEDPPTASDAFVQAMRSTAKGAVSGVSGLSKAIGEGAAFINRQVRGGGTPGTSSSGDPKDLDTYRFGKGLEDAAEAAWPDVPGLEDSFLFRDVPSGLGQVGGALVTGSAVRSGIKAGLGKLAVKEAGDIATRAGLRAGLTEMAGSEFDDAYQRAIDRGDSADLATLKAGGYAALATAIEAKLGVGRLQEKFGLKPTKIQDLAKVAGERVLKAGAKEAAAGFSEEALQRAAQDYIVDGELNLNAVVREGGAGAVIQALLGAAVHHKHRAKAQSALNWISEKQKDGITIADADASGLKPETLKELGIPYVIERPSQDDTAQGDLQTAAAAVPAEPPPEATAPADSSPELQSWLEAQAPPAPAEGAPGPEAAAPAGLDPDEARAHLEGMLGGSLPAYLDVYHEPGEAHAGGALVRGSNTDGAIGINTGNIGSTDELEAVLLHEGFHGVEQFPEVQDGIQRLAKAVPAAQIQAAIDLGYSPAEAPIETVARMLEQEHLSGKERGAWEQFWESVKGALQKSLGWAGVRFDSVDARRILAQSLRSLQAAAASGRPRLSLEASTVGSILDQTPPIEVPNLTLPAINTVEGKRALGDRFKALYGTTIEAADGTRVQVSNPRYSDWIKLFTHLVSENKGGGFNVNKAEWLPLLQHSLQNAQMRAVDPANGDRLYITRYAGPKPVAHVVIVTPKGNLKEFKAGGVAMLQTQFGARGGDKRWRFPVEWRAGKGPDPGPPSRTGPPSQGPGPQVAFSTPKSSTGEPGSQTKFALGDMREPGPDEGIRAHTVQMAESRDLDDTVKDLIDNYIYQRRTNRDDAGFAAGMVHQLGRDQAIRVFRAQGMPEAVRTMLGHAIVKDFGQAERQARIDQRLDQAQSLASQAADFIDQDVLPRSTEIAQALQAFRAFSYLTPSGWIATTKRVVETARGNRLAKVIPLANAISAKMREINAAALKRLPKEKTVAAATATAVETSIAKDPKVKAEVRARASESFGNLAGIVLTHFSGQGKVTLAQTLKSALGITAEEAMRKARDLEVAWKREVERVQKQIKPKVRQQRTLWERYQHNVAEAVLSEVKSKVAGPRRDPALVGFVNRLSRVLRAHVEAHMPATSSTPAPVLSPAQVMGEALKNPEKYEAAWSTAVDALRQEFGDDPAMMQRLEQVLMRRPDLIVEGTLDKAIAGKLKDLRLKVGDVVRRHFTEQAATSRSLSDRLIQDAGVDGPEALKLASVVQTRFGTLAGEAKARILANMVKGPGVPRAKRKTVAQKVIEFTNLGGFSDSAATEVMAEAMGVASLTPESSAEITKRASELQLQPEDSIQRHASTVGMMNYIARQKGLEWWELPKAFWYANTLSGPFTQLVNLSSNLLSLPGNIASILAHRPTAFLPAMAAAADGFRLGGLEAREILSSGIRHQQAGKLDAQGPLERLQAGDFKGAGIISKWKYVARLMAATDQLFYSSAREVKAQVLARNLAKQEGLRGKALDVRVREILGQDDSARSQAEAQASTEGLTGLDYARRVNQLLESRRPGQLSEDAHQFALLSTFNNQPYGLLGHIGEGIKLVNRKTKLTWLVVPFVDVVTNVVNDSLNYSPVGFGRAAWADWNLRKTGTGELFGQPVTNREAIYDAYAKAAIGTMGVAALLALAAGGDGDDDHWFQIFGQGPSNVDAKKGLKAKGWLPYSLKIGNRYWNFANTPLAVPLGILGNYLDAVRYRDLDKQDALTRVAYAFSQVPHVIAQQSFLDSVAQLFGALDHVSDTKAGDRAIEVLSRNVTTMVVPQALRQLDRLFDPRVMEPTDATQRLVRQIPFARRALSPALNALGEPVTLSPVTRWTSTEKGDALWNLLAEKRAWPSTPGQGLLTPDEHYSLVELRGALLKARLMASMGAIAAATPAQAKDIVGKLSFETTAKAKASLGFDRLEDIRKLTQQ